MNQSPVRQAVNPWFGRDGVEQKGLDAEYLFAIMEDRQDRKYIRKWLLKQVTNRLLHWSPSTVTEPNEERNKRLIETVLGYPRINGWIPFDLPLHPSASKALLTSLIFDSIPVSNEIHDMSLDEEGGYAESIREYFVKIAGLKCKEITKLNSMKLLKKKNWATSEDAESVLISAVLLRCLFVSLREWADVENIIEERLDSTESRLFIALHGLDADRFTHLNHIWNEDALQPLHVSIEDLRKKEIELETELEKIKFDGERLGELSQEKGELSHEQEKERDDLKKIHNRKKKVKERLDKYRKKMSRYEQFLHPNMQEKEKSMTFEFVWIKDWMDTWTRTNLEGGDNTIQRTIRGASRILELAMGIIREWIIDNYGVQKILIDGGGRLVFLVPESKEEEEIKNGISNQLCSWDAWRQRTEFMTSVTEALVNEDDFPKMMRKALPPCRIYEGELQEITDPELLSKNNDLTYLNSDCKECAGKISQEAAQSRNSLYRETKEICSFHRLLYWTGHHQRLRQQQNDPQTITDCLTMKQKEQERRRVSCICTLDGNAIGALFTFGDDSPNGKRRRSFRFNALWYNLLRKNLITEDKFSRLGAWVIAGDDITIADYGGQNETDERIRKLLSDLAQDLDKIRKEMGEISFSAGISLRRQRTNISDALNASNKAEKIAKYIWKGDIKDDDKAEKILTSERKLKERKFAMENNDKFERFDITREGCSIFVKYEDTMENFSLLENFDGEVIKQIRLRDGNRRDWEAVRQLRPI